MTVPSAVAEAGRLLAPDRAAWTAMLADHVADAGGHCARCRSTAVGSPVWPCRLRMVAEVAQQVAAGGT